MEKHSRNFLSYLALKRDVSTIGIDLKRQSIQCKRVLVDVISVIQLMSQYVSINYTHVQADNGPTAAWQYSYIPHSRMTPGFRTERDKASSHHRAMDR